MRLAVMQPYCFPYLGYFQLASSVDHFVFLDDVSFIRRGYINRNTLLQNGRLWNYTLPVVKASQNRTINQHNFSGDFSHFLSQLRHAYARAPFFEEIIDLVIRVCQPAGGNVAEICEASVREVFAYLGLPFSASRSSELDLESRAGEKIIELCRHYGADVYHNAPGGRGLYTSEQFSAHGIELLFVLPVFPSYPQLGGKSFVSGLSIIDVLMNSSPSEVRQMIGAKRLESA